VAIVPSTCSSVRSSPAPNTPRPAFETTTSMRSCSANARAITSSIWALSVTSRRAPQPVAELLGELVEKLGAAQCGGDAVAACQGLFGHFAADAAGRSGDEPGGHGISPVMDCAG
jgi:hypothetical protein